MKVIHSKPLTMTISTAKLPRNHKATVAIISTKLTKAIKASSTSTNTSTCKAKRSDQLVTQSMVNLLRQTEHSRMSQVHTTVELSKPRDLLATDKARSLTLTFKINIAKTATMMFMDRVMAPDLKLTNISLLLRKSSLTSPLKTNLDSTKVMEVTPMMDIKVINTAAAPTEDNNKDMLKSSLLMVISRDHLTAIRDLTANRPVTIRAMDQTVATMVTRVKATVVNPMVDMARDPTIRDTVDHKVAMAATVALLDTVATDNNVAMEDTEATVVTASHNKVAMAIDNPMDSLFLATVNPSAAMVVNPMAAPEAMVVNHTAAPEVDIGEKSE